ncbi:MAG: MoaD/ThiS family protein [Deltaproteobacteria bacterium]|nr:MoaD/ThiS family protein [Deltaproteobacteria bacterium]
MQIEIKLLTGLKQYLPNPDLTGTVRALEIAEPATVKTVLEKLHIPLDMPKVIMLNDRQGALEDNVNPGDRVTVFPPVGGG